MKISDEIREKATEFVAGIEQCNLKVYPDPPGQTKTWSVGYGHQLRGSDGLKPGDKITHARALQFLSEDISTAVFAVENGVHVDISEGAQIALISFAYNVGSSAFRKSTLLKLLNRGDSHGAAMEFPHWIFANGEECDVLKSRRKLEQALFLRMGDGVEVKG